MPHTLKNRMVSAGTVTIATYGVSQMLRFGANVLLARLLFPEAFGIMAIMMAVLVGVTLLTDVGLSLSVLRSGRAEEESFLNTIWTLQLIKGVVIAVLLMALAQPFGNFYNSTDLTAMLPVLGLTAFLSSTKSTKIDLAMRNLAVRGLAVIELVAQFTALTVMLFLAWYLQSAWALVWGGVTQAAAHSLLSHCTLSGPRSRLAWSSSVLREVGGFSAWIMAGSAVTYISGEGLNLLRAKLTSIAFMGQWSISSALTLMAWNVIQKLGGQVLTPAYAETTRVNPANLHRLVKRTRRMQVMLAWVFSVCLVLSGEQLIAFMYGPRYALAGLAVKIGAVGMVLSILTASYSGVLDAMGKPQLSLLLNLVHGCIRAACLSIGAIKYGEIGLLVANALASGLVFPFAWALYKKQGFQDGRLELAGFALAAGLAYWIGARL